MDKYYLMLTRISNKEQGMDEKKMYRMLKWERS